MATQSLARTPFEGMSELITADRNLRQQAERFSSELSSNVTTQDLLRILARLRQFQTRYGVLQTQIGSIPGIVGYIRDQRNDQTYNVAGEYSTLIGLIGSAVSLMEAGFANGANYSLERQFTPAQTAPLKAALDAIVAQIG